MTDAATAVGGAKRLGALFYFADENFLPPADKKKAARAKQTALHAAAPPAGAEDRPTMFSALAQLAQQYDAALGPNAAPPEPQPLEAEARTPFLSHSQIVETLAQTDRATGRRRSDGERAARRRAAAERFAHTARMKDAERRVAARGDAAKAPADLWETAQTAGSAALAPVRFDDRPITSRLTVQGMLSYFLSNAIAHGASEAQAAITGADADRLRAERRRAAEALWSVGSDMIDAAPAQLAAMPEALAEAVITAQRNRQAYAALDDAYRRGESTAAANVRGKHRLSAELIQDGFRLAELVSGGKAALRGVDALRDTGRDVRRMLDDHLPPDDFDDFGGASPVLAGDARCAPDPEPQRPDILDAEQERAAVLEMVGEVEGREPDADAQEILRKARAGLRSGLYDPRLLRDYL